MKEQLMNPPIISIVDAVKSGVLPKEMAKAVNAPTRDSKTARKSVVEQCLVAERDDGWVISYDEFLSNIVVKEPGSNAMRRITDNDYTRIAIDIEERYGLPDIPKSMLKDVLAKVAYDHAFDSAMDWATNLVWDGVPRVATFLQDYCSVPESEYATHVSLYMWSAIAGRCISPGVKADMVVTLVGDQGVRKSTLVEALAPEKEFFVEISLHGKDDDIARRMRGRLIGELGELSGYSKREHEWLKAFLTRTHDEWIPKWCEIPLTVPRRITLIATTNQSEFLTDSTGNRRWLPVTVGQIDTEGVVAVREQLWAEAVHLFNQNGVMWEGLDTIANDVRKNHEAPMTYEEETLDYLNRRGIGAGDSVMIRDILDYIYTDAPRRPDRGKADQMQVAAVLKKHGFKKNQRDKSWRKDVPPTIPTWHNPPF